MERCSSYSKKKKKTRTHWKKKKKQCRQPWPLSLPHAGKRKSIFCVCQMSVGCSIVNYYTNVSGEIAQLFARHCTYSPVVNPINSTSTASYNTYIHQRTTLKRYSTLDCIVFCIRYSVKHLAHPIQPTNAEIFHVFVDNMCIRYRRLLYAALQSISKNLFRRNTAQPFNRHRIQQMNEKWKFKRNASIYSDTKIVCLCMVCAVRLWACLYMRVFYAMAGPHIIRLYHGYGGWQLA